MDGRRHRGGLPTRSDAANSSRRREPLLPIPAFVEEAYEAWPTNFGTYGCILPCMSAMDAKVVNAYVAGERAVDCCFKYDSIPANFAQTSLLKGADGLVIPHGRNERTESGSARHPATNNERAWKIPDIRSFRKFQFVHPSEHHYSLPFHIARARELIESPLVYIYSLSIAQFIHSFKLHHAIEAGQLPPADDENAPDVDGNKSSENRLIGPLVTKLLYSMIMVGGKAVQFALNKFIENRPAFQMHLCRILDHSFVHQYEQYVDDWYELGRTNCFAYDDPVKLAVLESLNTDKKPFEKKFLTLQVLSLAESNRLPASVAKFSIIERRFSALVFWLTTYLKKFDPHADNSVRETARFVEHVESICPVSNVNLRHRFLEYLLLTPRFEDVFATLYAWWYPPHEAEHAINPPLSLTDRIPAKAQRMIKHKAIQDELKQAESADAELQLWPVVRKAKPSTCSLSEYRRERPLLTEPAAANSNRKGRKLKKVNVAAGDSVLPTVHEEANTENATNGACLPSTPLSADTDMPSPMSPTTAFRLACQSDANDLAVKRYLSLDLTFGQVEFITRREELRVFTEQLRLIASNISAKIDAVKENNHDVIAVKNQHMVLIGLNCKNFGDMGLKQEQYVSLLSIALNGECVIIIDIQAILATAVSPASTVVANIDADKNLWSNFSQSLFDEPLFRTILFGGQDELEMLSRLDGFVVPKTMEDFAKHNTVDLSHLFRYYLYSKPSCLGLNKDDVLKSKNSRNGIGLGLKELVPLLLDGIELDKTEQSSGWRRRPLRLMQVICAALDAHVLVLLHRRLAENCEREGVEFPPPLPKRKLVVQRKVKVVPNSTGSGTDGATTSGEALNSGNK